MKEIFRFNHSTTFGLRVFRVFALAVFVSVVPLNNACFSQEDVKKSETDSVIAVAVQLAQDWLVEVDARKYGTSWEEAATFFKMVVPPRQWISQMEDYGSRLGKIISRTVLSSDYLNAVPGAPAGDSVVIQFEAEFENKKEVLETVTMIKDIDGQWRSAGYFIK